MILNILAPELRKSVAADFNAFSTLINDNYNSETFTLLVTYFDKPEFPNITQNTISKEQDILRMKIRLRTLEFIFEKTADELRELLENNKELQNQMIQAIGHYTYLPPLANYFDCDKLSVLLEFCNTLLLNPDHFLRIWRRNSDLDEKKFKTILEWFSKSADAEFLNGSNNEVTFIREICRGYITSKGIKAFVDNGGDINADPPNPPMGRHPF